MLISAHQPDLFPHTGFWHRMQLADLFDVACWDQVNLRGYTHRVRMRGGWCTLAVQSGAKGARICDVKVQPFAAEQLWECVAGRYRGAKFWADRYQVVQDMLAQAERESTLSAFNLSLIVAFRELLSIRTPLSMVGPLSLGKTDGILEMLAPYRAVNPLGSVSYLSGVGGKEYLDVERMTAAGVSVWFSQHKPKSGDSILTAWFDEDDPWSVVKAEEETPW